MEEVDEASVTVKEVAIGSRKKQKKYSIREQVKKNFVGCKHNSARFSCSTIRPYDALSLRGKLFSCQDKVAQDNKVASWISVTDVKKKQRIPHREDRRGKPHSFKVKYTVPTKVGQTVYVCKKLFMHLTCFKSNRLNNICKLIKSGVCIIERRGDRVGHKSSNKKVIVREFIGNLKGSESHYNRKKSVRVYLHSELTQNKLRSIYNTRVAPEFQVSRTMFQRIFAEFNIGFKSPACDVCTYCTRLSLQIKSEKDIAKKNKLQLEKRIHKIRAAAFYALLREADEEETISYCFDLQQVQPFPKTPIQQAFYSRQISFYCFCIVDQSSKEPFFYTWTEDQAGRGSLEISSALLDFF